LDIKLIEFIKECIFKMRISFKLEELKNSTFSAICLNKKRIDVFSECIDFILNLINQNQEVKSLKSIIDNIDLEALVN
jgi:hypothetical protein